MHAKAVSRALWTCALGLTLVSGVNGYAGHAAEPPPSRSSRHAGSDPTSGDSHAASSSITTDVIVRDNRGQFIADLKKEDFEVFEDGVKQEVVSFMLTHGGRVYNEAAPPPPPPMEGIILPPSKPTNDAAGRIWLIFVDDLHLDFGQHRPDQAISSRRSRTSWFTKATCSASSPPGRRRSRSI